MNNERRTTNSLPVIHRSAFLLHHSLNGGGKNRTCDLAIIDRLLCQLSYATLKFFRNFNRNERTRTFNFQLVVAFALPSVLNYVPLLVCVFWLRSLDSNQDFRFQRPASCLVGLLHKTFSGQQDLNPHLALIWR